MWGIFWGCWGLVGGRKKWGMRSRCFSSGYHDLGLLLKIRDVGSPATLQKIFPSFVPRHLSHLGLRNWQYQNQLFSVLLFTAKNIVVLCTNLLSNRYCSLLYLSLSHPPSNWRAFIVQNEYRYYGLFRPVGTDTWNRNCGWKYKVLSMLEHKTDYAYMTPVA